ncbi:MAG: shikimate dehydrogenase [Fusobacteria bacterium]|nr:shikimate dehydrogenase [Fusobacteriota bacterium]
MRITSKTQLLCLLGHPVSHSKSPLMHNEQLENLGIDAKYLAFDVLPENLGEAIKGLKSLGYLGANVTIPHKEEAMKYVDNLTDEAKNIGAINTIYIKDGKTYGDNTDGRGFILSLVNDGGFDPKDKIALIIGAGGASKAVATKLLLAETKKIYLYDIDTVKMNSLKEHLMNFGKDTEVITIKKDELNNTAKISELIVNCTPIGMKETDITLIDENCFNNNQMVFDLIYNPEKTKLLQNAEKKGARILNGLGMLVYQGGLSFEKWTNKKPDTKKMFEIIKGV